MCDLPFGLIDICTLLLIVLPLYPNELNGYIYSVNLFTYTEITTFNKAIHWILFLFLIISGVSKTLLTKYKAPKNSKIITDISMGLHILTVLFLALARESYAIVVAFLLLIIKGMLLFKYTKPNN